jgi:hypothetical protein
MGIEEKFNLRPIETLAEGYSSETDLDKEKIYQEGVDYFLDKYSELKKEDESLVETIRYMTSEEFRNKFIVFE